MHYVVRIVLKDHLNNIMTLEDKRYSFWALACLGLMFKIYAEMILYINTIEENNLPEWSTRILEKCGAEELEEAFATYSVLALGN